MIITWLIILKLQRPFSSALLTTYSLSYLCLKQTNIYRVKKLIRNCTLVDGTETSKTQFSNVQARCSVYSQNQSYLPYFYRYKILLFLMEKFCVCGSLARMAGPWVLLQESTYLGVEFNSMFSSRWQQLGWYVRIKLISEGVFWSAVSVHDLEGIGAASGFPLS